MRKETISVAVYSAHGNPADVLRIETKPWPRPGPDEVVVAMQAAPINPVQAAMLKINPLTAWQLLHGYMELKSGDWVIQNAANSAAGRAVIQIAHAFGYKTVNVVRREGLVEELRSEGGDVVLLDDENLR